MINFGYNDFSHLYAIIRFKQSTLPMNASILKHMNLQSEILLTYKNYAFKKLNSSQKDLAILLLTREFNADEPLTKGYLKKFPAEREKSAQKWRRYWQLYADDFCSNQLSVAAYDMENNGELVGLAIGRDINFHPAHFDSQIMNDINIVSVTAMLEKKMIQLSDKKYQAFFNEKHKMIFFMGGVVKPKHSKKGLFEIMSAISERLAAAKGYLYCSAYLTNFKTITSAKSNNYQTVVEFNVHTFEVNGIHYYEKVEDIDKKNVLVLKKLKPEIVNPKL